jgi:DNA primase
MGVRAQPASRADHATRILLGQSHLWEALSGEDHSMLCELPAPHGSFFVWLESQLHDHGPLTWSALREELTGQTFEALALRLMSGPTQPGENQEEAAPELRDLLARMLIERLKDQETHAIEASASDPSALQRYRDLQTRRKILEQQQSAGIIQH